MDDAAVVMLDPMRMVALEAHLDGFARGCRQQAGIVTDALAAASASSPGAVAELRALARWADSAEVDVARRRRQVEDLPLGLPHPARARLTPPERDAAVEDIVASLQGALQDDTVDWGRLRAALRAWQRVRGDAVVSAEVVEALGPEVLRELPGVLHRALGGSGLTGLALDAALTGSLAMVTAAIGDALQVEGPSALVPELAAAVLGLDVRDLDDPDPGDVDGIDGSVLLQLTETFGGRWAPRIASALGAGRLAAVLGTAGAVVSLVHVGTAVGVGEANPASISVAAGSGLLVVAAGSVAASVAPLLLTAAAGAALIGVVLTFATAPEEPTPHVERHTDPATGRAAYSGGGVDTPWQSTAGGPLPPTMVR